MSEDSGWVRQDAIEWEAVVKAVDGFDPIGGGVKKILSVQWQGDAAGG
jgi:hypothetical protein